MTLIDRETLSILNPIFKISRVQILWDDDVLDVEKNGTTHKRICLISTTGIYIIKKKSFPHPAKITSSIIISDLATISVVDDKCSFMSSHTQITIQHKNACMFASVVYCVRKAQFPPSILPLTITFPNDDNFELINENSPYQPSSLFIDRVITCALHLKVDIQSNIIQQIQSDLKITENTFTITKSICKSPLFDAILISLPYDLDLHKIVVDSCQLSIVFRFFNELLLRGQHVNEISFKSCDFSNSLPFFKQGVTTNGLFKPSKWTFNSIVINESFSALFDSLTLLNCDIKSLTFENCEFSNETMSAVFQSIFFNSCFHHLEFFALNGSLNLSELPFQIASLTCCSWVLLSKCLHMISIKNCSIDVQSILPQLLNSDNGLTNLCLSGGRLVKPLVFERTPVLNHLTFLDLSNLTVTFESVMSVFDIIKSGNLIIDGLDLSSISFTDDNDKKRFYSKIENITVEPLKTLVFNENVMDENQTRSFALFLNNQSKNLTHLYVNNSIDVSQSSDSVLTFLDSIKSIDNLTSLSLRSDKSSNFSFGLILAKQLFDILSKKSLKYVDLTCQCISDVGLNSIKTVLESENNKIEELLFDGSHPTSVDSLFEFCNTVINSNLKYSSFPCIDLNTEIEKLKNKNIKDYDEKIVQIKNIENKLSARFASKFTCKETNQNEIWMKQAGEVKRVTQSTSKSSINENSIPSLNNFSFAPFFNEYVVKRDKELDELFKEAVDTKSEDFREAIYRFVDKVDDQLSFRNIMNTK